MHVYEVLPLVEHFPPYLQGDGSQESFEWFSKNNLLECLYLCKLQDKTKGNYWPEFKK